MSLNGSFIDGLMVYLLEMLIFHGYAKKPDGRVYSAVGRYIYILYQYLMGVIDPFIAGGHHFVVTLDLLT